MRYLLVAFSGLLVGCDSGGASDPDPVVVLKLDVGNRWIYQTQSQIGTVETSSVDTFSVVSDTVALGTTWYRMETRRRLGALPNGWYANRSDGTWFSESDMLEAGVLWLPLLSEDIPTASPRSGLEFRLLSTNTLHAAAGLRATPVWLYERTITTLESPVDGVPLRESLVDSLYIRPQNGPVEFGQTWVGRAAPDYETLAAVGRMNWTLLDFTEGAN